jgi:hypothetical protein
MTIDYRLCLTTNLEVAPVGHKPCYVTQGMLLVFDFFSIYLRDGHYIPYYFEYKV